jgi:hypothetical protein
MPLPVAFQRHGTFIYNARNTIDAFGSANDVADAIVACKMSNAWVRVHGRRDDFSKDAATKDLVDALRDRKIAVAGWGWCQSDDPAKEAQLAIDSMRGLGLSDYIADIEEGVNDSHWTPSEVDDFLGRVRKGLPKSGALAVSSFAIITWHSPDLMRAADRYVDAFAPQTYWFRYPNAKMRKQFGKQYALNNAAAYVELCIANWRTMTRKPLIATGQAYWREGITQTASEAKVEQFLSDFKAWSDLAGFNWWFFGGGTGMSAKMQTAIAAAKLDQKKYTT